MIKAFWGIIVELAYCAAIVLCGYILAAVISWLK